MVRPSTNALARWQRFTVLGSWWGLLLTGLAWLPAHHLWGAGAGELPGPVEPWLLRGHGLAAAAALFAFGLVGAGHVKHGWRRRQQRASGLAVCVGGGILVASGYALSYLVPESWHGTVGWAHAALGVLAFGVVVAHSHFRGLGATAHAVHPPASGSVTRRGSSARAAGARAR